MTCRVRAGDGVSRVLEFTRPVTLSILSERRALQPYGLNGIVIFHPVLTQVPHLCRTGGHDGASGLNLLHFNQRQGSDDERRTVNLGGKATVNVSAGDVIEVHTPAGGGYGTPNESSADASDGPTPNHLMAWLRDGGSLNRFKRMQETA